MSEILIRYWDSDCFLGWFNKEKDKIDLCRGTLTKAQNGELNIVTSALTLTEVIKIKGKQRLPKEKEQTIIEFFENDFILIRNVDRFIAEFARNLIWTYSMLNPKDSIHIATAVLHNIHILNTFDKELLELNEIIELNDKSGKLKIINPDIAHQGDIFENER
ncbi:MAG: type II toxin-antitoxin system VapC family toxin [Promethearchaeota archaeon]